MSDSIYALYLCKSLKGLVFYKENKRFDQQPFRGREKQTNSSKFIAIILGMILKIREFQVQEI